MVLLDNLITDSGTRMYLYELPITSKPYVALSKSGGRLKNPIKPLSSESETRIVSDEKGTRRLRKKSKEVETYDVLSLVFYKTLMSSVEFPRT